MMDETGLYSDSKLGPLKKINKLTLNLQAFKDETLSYQQFEQKEEVFQHSSNIKIKKRKQLKSKKS